MLSLPPLGVYVHLPWCVRKCPYCDFNSHALKESPGGGRRLAVDQEAAYVDALLEDLALDLPLLEQADTRPVETVFIGGGTPSLFSAEAIARLLAGLRERLPFAPECELTLEANPGTLECGRFAGYREAGINRISVGAQSFSPAQLRQLGRIHAADDTRAAVAELHAAGMANYNLDLMYALPGQSAAEALADVEAALALAPPHLSYYQLTLEPGTVFHHRPPAAMPDDEAAADLEAAAHARIASAGYHRYEVSAWTRAGRECRHNLNYWRYGDYLGLGAGAHGKLTRPSTGEVLRTEKAKQPREYQAGLAGGAARTVRAIAPAERPFEFMLNALRLADGFPARIYEERTGLPLGAQAATLARLAERGWLQDGPGNDGHGERWLRPTARGYSVLNSLVEAFLP